MDPVKIIVDGVPVAKGRPRISTRGGFPRAYTPAKTRQFEDVVKLAAGLAMKGRAPLDEPVSVSVSVVLPVPVSWSKKRQAEALAHTRLPVSRPDIDNYAKAALDACNSIVYRDDSVITDLRIMKRYGARPRLVIVVSARGGRLL